MTRQAWNIGQVDSGIVVMGNGNKLTQSGDQRPRRRSTVGPAFGIVTALPEEFVAVRALLDRPTNRTVDSDRAHYVIGTLPSRLSERPHHVVVTMLGATGNDAAAESCANLARSFESVSCVIMSGIAAGVPNVGEPHKHVRLGDTVVGTWGIVDYDHVTETDAGQTPRRPFPRPSPMLTRCALQLQANEMLGERPWEEWILRAEQRLSGNARPPEATDVLHSPSDPLLVVPHPAHELSGHRPGHPKVHYGHIGSADRSLRSGEFRDRVAQDHDLRAFEMEGKGIGSAGFAHGLEWFVVRGVSDYGDSRTTPRWRGYASIVAAAYVRALLAECPPINPRGSLPMATD